MTVGSTASSGGVEPDLRNARYTAGAVLLIVNAVVYLGAEAVAAAAWRDPAYSYRRNYISDLGVPDIVRSDGRLIDSPLHGLMNTAFLLHGAVFLLAALLIGPAVRRRRLRWAYLTAAVAHGVGNGLVGLFPSSGPGGDGDPSALHGLGAVLAIVGGNAAAIIGGIDLLGRRVRRLGATFVALGTVGVVAFGFLLASMGTDDDGVPERISVYAINAAEILAGFAVVAARRRDGEHRVTPPMRSLSVNTDPTPPTRGRESHPRSAPRLDELHATDRPGRVTWSGETDHRSHADRMSDSRMIRTVVTIAMAAGAVALAGCSAQAAAPTTVTSTADAQTVTATVKVTTTATATPTPSTVTAAPVTVTERVSEAVAAANEAPPAAASAEAAPTSRAAASTTRSGLPASQQAAVSSAQSYLKLSGFSRQGLIDQLSSEYGDKFSVADATAAVDSLTVDWNAEAAQSAESYTKLTGFSCQGLIDQLSSEYGDQFTAEQATFGATSVGLC